MGRVNLSGKADKMLGSNPGFPSRGGVTILLVGSCCRNQDKLCLNVPLGSTADCTFLR